MSLKFSPSLSFPLSLSLSLPCRLWSMTLAARVSPQLPPLQLLQLSLHPLKPLHPQVEQSPPQTPPQCLPMHRSRQVRLVRSPHLHPCLAKPLRRHLCPVKSWHLQESLSRVHRLWNPQLQQCLRMKRLQRMMWCLLWQPARLSLILVAVRQSKSLTPRTHRSHQGLQLELKSPLFKTGPLRRLRFQQPTL